MPNPLKCCNCGKKIAEEIAIQAGVIKITCKCGTVNEVRAAVKERENYQTKGFAVVGECGGPETIKLPEGTSVVPNNLIAASDNPLPGYKKTFYTSPHRRRL